MRSLGSVNQAKHAHASKEMASGKMENFKAFSMEKAI